MLFNEFRTMLNEAVEKIDGHKVEFIKKGAKIDVKIDGHFFDSFKNEKTARNEIAAFIKAAQ